MEDVKHLSAEAYMRFEHIHAALIQLYFPLDPTNARESEAVETGKGI